MMSIMTKICMLIGFITAMVAVSTAENAIGEKFWLCIIAGFGGLALFALGVCFNRWFCRT